MLPTTKLAQSKQQLLQFTGEIDNLAVRNCVQELEKTLVELGARPAKVQKFNNVLIELMQNVMYHNIFDWSVDERYLPDVDVSKTDRGVEIAVSSTVNTRQRATITTYLNALNEMDKQTLRDRYKQVMADGEFSDAGTAGMGFLDVARKAKDNKLHFAFDSTSSEEHRFTITAIV